MSQNEDVILKSNLFNLDFYQKRRGKFDSVEAAVADYVAEGEALGFAPGPRFDPAFYLENYADVGDAGSNAFHHYIAYGAAEGRYGSPSELFMDEMEIRESKLFDEEFYRGQLAKHNANPSSYLRHLLLSPPGGELWPNEAFDPRFYRLYYADDFTIYRHPMLHYLRSNPRPTVTSFKSIASDYDFIRSSGEFDAEFYRRQVGQPASAAIDPITHYLCHGKAAQTDPNARFSTSFYLRRNVDIANGHIHPFVHFLKHGREEGRVAGINLDRQIESGSKLFDPGRETVIIVSHDCSQTGAPLLALNLIRNFSASFNVITWVGNKGPLLETLKAESAFLIAGFIDQVHCDYLLRILHQQFTISFVIANSVESAPVAVAASKAMVPVVSLVHEFAEYTLPPGRSASNAEAADIVVVPAKTLSDSLQKEMRYFFQNETSNIRILPQGKLKFLPRSGHGSTAVSGKAAEIFARLRQSPSTKVIIGAGSIQPRKGIDLFIQLAAQMKKTHPGAYHFVWVGDGYRPESDLNYSIWLKDAVERADLEETFDFMPAQASLDEIFSLSSAFVLSSRLDPFPNVVVDAMAEGLPVFFFRGTTGIQDLEANTALAIHGAPFLDIAGMGDAIAHYFDSGKTRSEANIRYVKEQLDFDLYCKRLLDVCQEARESAALDKTAYERILEADLFDEDFYEPSSFAVFEKGERLLRYAKRASKGVLVLNPAPGYHEGLLKQRKTGPLPPLAVPETAGPTHQVVFLDGKKKTPSAHSGKVGVHIHLHYPELAADYVRHLDSVATDISCFVTVTSADGQRGVEEAFSRAQGISDLDIEIVDNRGRDIGPFLSSRGLAKQARDWDVIGHFHGKKTVDVAGDLGARWRIFLMETLIGNASTYNQIMSIFNGDTVGLVFAEDRHTVGWGKNLDYAKDWARTLSLRVPDYPCFPLGTMFWARPAIFEKIWALNLTAESFPAEPLPYDGSMLHAIERLMPQLCEAAGLEWRTIHRPGVSW